jgi:peptidoglycan/LPS O-acetylase OafA/YrhL
MNHMKIQEIFAYYCCFLTLAVPFIFCSFKSNKTDRAIGNFAYIIFAVHFISGKLVMMIPYHVTVDLFYPMLFTVALATYYGIEVPVENFRARVNGLMRKSAPRAVAVAVAAELKPGARAMPVVQDRPSI